MNSRFSATRVLLGLLCLLSAASGTAMAREPGDAPPISNASGSTELRAGFVSPPAPAHPDAYWCWLNGFAEPDYFAHELAEYKAKGIQGVYIFDIGAKDPDQKIPAGPAFMGPASVKAIARAVAEAGKLGMDVGLITSSSWNAGGDWVTPEHAAKGLFQVQLAVTGPRHFAEKLPLPKIPKKAPQAPDGTPLWAKDVAVLAVPEMHRLPGHEFLFELPEPGLFTVDHVVLYNTLSEDAKRFGPQHLFAQDFSVSVGASPSTAGSGAFHEVVAGRLQPKTGPQRFDFPPTPARFVKLLIRTGYNERFDRVELGEFEVYSTKGVNVVSAYHADGSRTGARLMHYSSALGRASESDWTARNIHDQAKSGAGGSWSSAGPPPLVVPDIDKIVDLTDQTDCEGRLTWDVPAGKWTIMRFVCLNTGQAVVLPSPHSAGLAIDHFSAEATEMHFRTILDRLKAEMGSFENTALKTMYVCSYELRGSVWTPDFLDEFRQRRGYDMRSFLPVLFGAVIKSPEYSERFQYDYNKTLGDLLVDAFYRRAREISNQYGLLLCAEAGGPGPPLHQVPVDALKAQGAVDIPRGEFWNAHNVWVVKETACAAHVYGKPLVDMEAFTSWRHWQDGPFELKPLADRAMCGGTNHFTFHTGSHSPPRSGSPGWVYHAGTHMNPRLAWWPMAGAFVDYLARCSFLLQQGQPVSDVCYYYGDQGFNFVPPKHIDPALGPGYDYDVTNAEVILSRMHVRDGRITLPSGVHYELLVLPDRRDMDLKVLQQLEKLAGAGATIVGRKPTRSNGLQDYPGRDQQVSRLADQLWGPCNGRDVLEHAYGKGRVVWGKKLRAILAERGLGPDFQYTGRDAKADLDFIHRRTTEADIYFVRNKNPRREYVECTFRVTRGVPEIWEPDSGRTRVEPVFARTGKETTIPLNFEPLGSVFVVFRRDSAQPYVVSVSRDGKSLFPRVSSSETTQTDWRLAGTGPNLTLTTGTAGRYSIRFSNGRQLAIRADSVSAARAITGPWKVDFTRGPGAPPSALFPTLVSWTQRPEEGIRYFSGVARYEREFQVPEWPQDSGRRVTLDLGRVRFAASVTLNGRTLGTLWKPPFRLDVTSVLHPGANRLVVEVANTWSNRLTGDALQPPEKRLCSTNMKYALSWESPWKETPLHESGLLGPVSLRFTRLLKVE